MFYHLRPGTYDITVKRSISSIKKRKIVNLSSILSFKNTQKIYCRHRKLKKIDKFLLKNKCNFNTFELYNYIVLSLKLRENSKFIFTRSLSDYLQIIEKWGQKKSMNVEKLSNIEIKNILKKFQYFKYKI